MKRLWNLLTLWKRPQPVVGATPSTLVHRENKWRLLRYKPRPEGLAHKTPILLIPSLINRHYVLDLKPGKSMVEYLVEQGHDVYIMDWGTPGPEDRYLTFDEICDTYIGRALRKTTESAGAQKAHVLGYCLGGTLSVIHAAVKPERIASLTTLAAPVDFTDDGMLSAWTRMDTFDVDTLVEATGNVPWQILQASFHMLRPTMNLAKAVHVIDQAWDDEFLDGFFALEKWSNDNISFPGECYRTYITDLYKKNALMRDDFYLSGRQVKLSSIQTPLLSIIFKHDNIVPYVSAAPLHATVASKDKHEVYMRGGHIGAVVSRKARTRLWPNLSTWWAERDHLGNPQEPQISIQKDRAAS